MAPHVFVYLRPEARFNPTFDDATADRSLNVWQTLRGSLDASRGNFSATLQIQHVGAWGERAKSTDATPSVMAYQGYVEIGDKKQWVRIGRQEIHMLNGFYLSNSPWHMAGRSFDAVRVHWTKDAVELDVMGIMEAPPLPESENLRNASYGDQLAAIFGTVRSNESLEQSFWL